jgi:excisionase family DNA binding protein
VQELQAAEAVGVPKLLTPGKVAEITGRHPKTILEAFNRGELAGIRLGARTVRFTEADVQDYISRHRTASVAP